jgi:hypothetical protein
MESPIVKFMKAESRMVVSRECVVEEMERCPKL